MAATNDAHPVAPAKTPPDNFALYTCWHRRRVYEVMNTEAEKTPDDVFLAVHTSHPLNLVNLDPAIRGVQEQITPETFLARFLDERQPHVQAVILGESGSGKSHLIQWMRLNIPDDPNRVVITIPKAGTGLRGVVNLLISALPPATQDTYLEKLRASGGDHQPAPLRRQRLCSEIALALLTNEVLGDRPVQPAGPTDQQVRADLAELLPSIFRDPALIPLLTKDRGIIAGLVDHIDTGTQVYLPSDQPRVFTADDLPLVLPDQIYAAMGAPARMVCDQLAHTPELQAVALSLINSALQVATRQMLSLASDDLGSLMADIRRHFKRQGKHLVLLIEDFAILRGIDRPLLDALIQSGQNTDLCSLHWAMAVTTGYYGRVADTVQTRMDYVVDMDLPRDAAGLQSGIAKTLSDEEIVAFAARYLNVARMPTEELEAWHATAPAHRTPVPNACGLCVHRAICHSSFGEVDSIGLYPLNRTALLLLARSQNRDFDERFNPRSLIRQVLAPLLDLGRVATSTHAIEENAFPPEALLQRVGGSQIDAVIQQRWLSASPTYGQRQITLSTIWGDQNKLGLDQAVYDAFGVPVPSGPFPPPPPPSGKGGGVSPPPPPPQEQAEMAAISAWMNSGRSLPQNLTTKLRNLVFEALLKYIDWDQEGLSQSDFMGAQNKIFRSEFIIFQNPAVPAKQDTSKSVRLNIPLSNDSSTSLRAAGIALEALLLFDRQKGWETPTAASRLPFLANCLEQWSRALIRQLHAIYRPPESNWDPVARATELLAIGATLAGRPSALDSTTADLHGLIFTTLPEVLPAGTGSRWRTVYNSIYRKRDSLVRAIRSVASGTKGGEAGRFLDASRTFPAMVSLRRRHWRVEQPLSSSAADLLQSPYQDVAKLQREIFERLPGAAQEALDQRRKWLAEVRQAIAPDTTRAALIDQLDSVKNAAFQVGIAPTDAVRRNFEEALNGFRNVQYQAAVDAAERVIADASRDGTDDPLRVLPALGRTRMAAVEATSALIAAAPPYLSGLRTQLSVKRTQVQSFEAAKLFQDKAAIRRDLSELIRLLGVVANLSTETFGLGDPSSHALPAPAGHTGTSAPIASAEMIGTGHRGGTSAPRTQEAPSTYLMDLAHELGVELREYSELLREQGDAERFQTRANALSAAIRAINPLASLAPVFARQSLVVEVRTALVMGLRTQAARVLERFEADPETIIEPDASLNGSFWEPLRTLAAQHLTPPFREAWHRHLDASLPAVNAALLAHLKSVPALVSKVERVQGFESSAQALRQFLPANAGAFSDLASVSTSLREALHQLFGSADENVPPEVLAFLEQASAPGGATIEFLTPEVRDWLTSRDLLASLRLRWQGAAR